jgi:N6-adenosine-specific RNA methylase IME4
MLGLRFAIMSTVATDLLESVGRRRFATVLADPPWQFTNRTGKIAPEHHRLARYPTMTLGDIAELPVAKITKPTAHLYLWCPNALLPDGLAIMEAWGFGYKSNLVWHKVRKDGGSDGRGVGFYFRNVTELLLFGVRGKSARTLAPARSQVNFIATRKREHSRKRRSLTPQISAPPHPPPGPPSASPRWPTSGSARRCKPRHCPHPRAS